MRKNQLFKGGEVMSFKMKYKIIPKYLTKGTKRRSGIPMKEVKFNVAHDTGNDGSTALQNINYYENSHNAMSASAHLFIDDTGIYECVPLLTASPEKAWHVIYNKTKDNELFGDDANDIAAGIELCYSHNRGNINNEESYNRYVWVLAYIAYKFNFSPKNVIGHHVLDPGRKTDPVNSLSKMGKTYEQLLNDVINEYDECTKPQLTKERIVDIMSKYFADTSGHWSEAAIDQLHERNIFGGVKEDGKLLAKPNDNITRAETAALLNRAIDYVLQEVKK
jgi:N-acetylmuramoyl-L-alanine amidase